MVYFDFYYSQNTSINLYTNFSYKFQDFEKYSENLLFIFDCILNLVALENY